MDNSTDNTKCPAATQAALHRRRADKGLFKSIPYAAIISAASLAWYISVSWVNFRDSVFNNLHAIELRVASLESYRTGHAMADDERYKQFLRIEDAISGTGNIRSEMSELERRTERLEQGKQRKQQ